MATKFPQVIHVTQEQPVNDDPFLVVEMDGVMGIEESGAIYETNAGENSDLQA